MTGVVPMNSAKTYYKAEVKEMKGFTGEYYNGLPVFIREEYEAVNGDRSEKDRLEDMIGTWCDSLQTAMGVAEQQDPRLLYHTKDYFYDSDLRKSCPPEVLWVPYKNGWVFELTGEFVNDAVRPKYDSCPAWFKGYYDRGIVGGTDAGGEVKDLFKALCGLAAIILAATGGSDGEND